MIVVDASIVLAWHFEDEATVATDAFRAECEQTTLYVPSHWLAEVANSLFTGERRKRATEAQSARFIHWLALLAAVIDGEGGLTATTTLLPLARQHRLTVYDAAYLELAMRRNLPLATLDGALAAAARAAGVALIPL